MRSLFSALVLVLAALATPAWTATFYVSTVGSDSQSGTTLSTAWATFAHAWSVMRAGDTLLVADGTYRQRIAPTVTGTNSAHLTIRAINDGAVVIDGQGTLDGPISLGGPYASYNAINYVDVTGIVVVNCGQADNLSACVWIWNDHNTVKRVSAYNADADANSSVIWIMGNDNLVEDCVAGGMGRKMVLVFSEATRNIIRRTFAAWQQWNGAGTYNPGVYPWGDQFDLYNSRNNIIENSVAYGMAPGPGSGFEIQHQGGAAATGNALLGTMSIRMGKKWNGDDMTWACPDPYRTPQRECATYANNIRQGYPFRGLTVDTNLLQDVLAWGNAGAALLATSAGSTNQLIRATFINNGLGSGESGGEYTAGSLSHFGTIRDTYIEGSSYQGGGARLQYRYESSFNGDTAIPNLTTTPLWPWPMESRIRSELGIYLSRWLSVNPEMKDFSVTGAMQNIFGSLPAAINPLSSAGSTTDAQAPSVPTNVGATAASSSQINLSWSASTDNVGVVGYRIYRNGTQVGTSATTSYSNAGLLPATQYSFTVAAYDAAGNVSAQSSAASATTQVVGDAQPPTISILSPAAGATVSGSVTLSASGADNVGVVGVQFLVDALNAGAEDTIPPYSISFDTTALTNGAHSITARARDAAGNSATSNTVSVTVSNNVAQGALSVASITDNRAEYTNSQVPQYAKFEVTFQVANTVATNSQLPYDPAPPAGIAPTTYPLHNGISVDALFTPDNWTTVFRQPAFYYQVYEDGIKASWDGANHEWFYPTGFAWKVRFAPDRVGAWQFKIVARDASGATESATQTFTVSSSTNRGFLKVSRQDPRYFEFDDGTPFYPAASNATFSIADPVLGNEPLFANLAQNHINFQRFWISSLYGSAWLEWLGGRNIYDGYLPRPGLEPFHDSVASRDQMTQVLTYPSDWYDSCRLQFWNDPEAVKQNTAYSLRITYWGTNIAGPRLAGLPFGVVGKMTTAQVPNCQEPGVGTVITDYGANTSNWGVVEGTWYSGSNNFLPRVYLALENATQGKVFISSVSLRENLGNGQFGPEIIKQPSMQYELYFAQESSYAFDKLLALAEKYGIYLKLVLSDKDDKIFTKLDDDGTFVIGGESDNQDGFYGLGRTVNKTRWLQQAWWRYAQARWGYSTSIHSWELTNEGDPFLTTHWELTDEFGKFMRCRVFGIPAGNGDGATCATQQPNRHMVTTSFWHSFPAYSAQTGQGFWGNPKYPNVDYADVHAYISTSTAPLADRTLMQDDSAYYHLWHSSEYGNWRLPMPVVRGEAGMDLATSHATSVPGLYSDTQGAWYHDYIWSSLDRGALYEMYWFFRPDIYNEGVYDHRPVALSFANFLAGVPINNGNYQDIAAQVSDSNLRVAGQKDLVNSRAHFWIQNKNHTWRNVVNGVAVAPVSGSVQIPGFVAGRVYTVEWWDPYKTTNQVTSTQSLSAGSDGVLTLSIQQLTTDVAIRVSSPAASSNRAPVVNAGPDLTGTVGSAITLGGSVTDDGVPGSLSITWAKVSGPGTVTFNNPAVASATALMSTAGTYVLRLSATDSLLSSSDDCTIVVTSSDTAPPSITTVTATSVTSSGAVISWTTNEAADGQVDYGTSTSYGQSTPLDSSMTTAHAVSIGGLTSGQTYHYRVRSRDAQGNTSVSGDFSFTTSGAAPLLPPPSVSSVGSLSPGAGWNACDLGQDGVVNVVDVQIAVNMNLGSTPCSAGINGLQVCNETTVQRVIDAALGLACLVDSQSSPRAVTATWAPSPSPGVAGYDVYRATSSGGPFTKLNPALMTALKFVDITVQSGRTYYYVVAAVDGANNQGAYSTQSSAVVP